MKFRIHCLGVPHTATTREYVGCAFTQKVHKFLKMMSGRGHQIFHYGHEERDWDYPDVEHIPVTNESTLEQAYGKEYTEEKRWKSLGFAHYYNISDYAYTQFHANTIKEINKRKQPNDIVLHFFGWGHKAISDAIPELIHIEPGIGYGSTCQRWRVYESYHMRSAAGGLKQVNECNQDNYEVVIPNYFDAEDFEYSETKDDYILYLGRIYTGKGVDIAVEVAEHTGKRLIIAGQGTLAQMGYSNLPSNITEVGYADAETRKRLMSRAQALFIASKYGEPFGGVQVEAWLSGTPVISPDYAAFAEMNRHNITGFRCRTFRDYVEAVENVQYLLPIQSRKHGERYLLENIAPEYERYFQDVTNIYTGRGWYTI